MLTSTGASVCQALVEPLITTVEEGYRRSPLTHVLKATDSVARELTGMFFGVDGRELLSSQGNAIFTMNPTNSARSLGQLLLNRPGTGVNASDRLWVDAVEFRGALSGGPVLVTPGSTFGSAITLPNPSATYDPLLGGLVINPGPVVLGGRDVVSQPATNAGWFDPGSATTSIGTINAGSSASVVVDASSCPLSAFYFVCTPSTNTGSIRITAARRVVPLATGAGTFNSSVLSIDETFTITAASEQTVHIELDQGLWQVTIYPTTANLNSSKWAQQRFM